MPNLNSLMAGQLEISWWKRDDRKIHQAIDYFNQISSDIKILCLSANKNLNESTAQRFFKMTKNLSIRQFGCYPLYNGKIKIDRASNT